MSPEPSLVQGSEFDDEINARSSFNNGYSDFAALYGMGGNDRLTAGYYTGTMSGGEGNDFVDGRGSQYLQTLDGGAGDDILYTATNTFASAFGGDGNDTIYAHGAISGGAGNDKIFVQFSYYAGQVTGDAGDDEIQASSVAAIMAGGDGSDIVRGGTGNDTLGSAGLNPPSFPSSGLFVLANDMALDRDQMFGGDGDDILAIGYGDDADGGAGADTLRLSLGGATAGVVLDTTDRAAGRPFSFGGGTVVNVEKLTYLNGSAFADVFTIATQALSLVVDGGEGNDTATSGDSSVIFNGGGGDDRFVSGRAGDVFDGGTGFDAVDYSGQANGVSVQLGLTPDASGTGAGGDRLVNVESVIGTDHNDTLGGSQRADVLIGGGGDDILVGGDGNDRLEGNAGNDMVVGGFGNDRLDGGEGDDTLITGPTGDVFLGGFGYNPASGGGNDEVIGGAGSDRAYLFYADRTDGVTFDNSALNRVNAVTAGGASAGSITGVERVTFFGGSGVDTVTGGVGADELFGGAGNDTLRGGAEDDTLHGGIGDDVLDGGEQSSAFFSGDTVSYGLTNAGGEISAGVQVDLRVQGVAQDTAGGGRDTLIGIENLVGSRFTDRLQGDGGVNRLTDYGGGSDRLFGDGGADWLEVQRNSSAGQAATLLLDGGEGNDNLTFYAFQRQGDVATLLGGAGRDTIRTEAEGASVTIDGGMGDDVVTVSAVKGTYRIATGEGSDSVALIASYGAEASGASVRVTDFTTGIGGDRIDLGEWLFGSALVGYVQGSNPFSGGFLRLAQSGADTLLQMDRNGGGDAFVTLVTLSDTLAAAYAAENLGRFAQGPEQVGAAGNDTLTGSAGDDRLFGASGNDTLLGGGGADLLDGGTGADQMTGGAGDDVFVVDSFADVVTEAAGEGVDMVRTAIGSRTDYTQLYTLAANVEKLTGTGAAGQGVRANTLDNTVAMGAGADLIVLDDGGVDSVTAGDGNDYIYYGATLTVADMTDGGAGVDTVGLVGSYSLTLGANSLVGVERIAMYTGLQGGTGTANSYAITTVDANVADGAELFVIAASLTAGETLTFNGSAERDGRFTVLAGAGADVLVGGARADYLAGGAGGDQLFGLDGNDTLVGGAGADVLRGGNGRDMFEFAAVSDSTAAARDTIVDFNAGVDRIDLSQIDAVAGTGGNDAFAFIGSATFGNSAGQLRAYQANGSWFVEGDTNGDGVADFALQVMGSGALGAGDFLL